METKKYNTMKGQLFELKTQKKNDEATTYTITKE